jgi:hypothetical protein
MGKNIRVVKIGFATSWSDTGWSTAWAGNKADAERAITAGGIENATIEQVTIPTDRAGLIAWLNKNAND